MQEFAGGLPQVRPGDDGPLAGSCLGGRGVGPLTRRKYLGDSRELGRGLVGNLDTACRGAVSDCPHDQRHACQSACQPQEAGSATVRPVSAGIQPRLIVLRGNSGAGKSSVAAGIRDRYGRGIAMVGQDNLRRTILRERDVPGGANIDLINMVARFGLGCGFHVIVEGILRAAHYGPMLEALHRDHQSTARFYYLDVPLEETLRRHVSRPQAAEFGEVELRTWYCERDLLSGGMEQIIPAASSLEDTVRLVMQDAGFVGDPLQPSAQP